MLGHVLFNEIPSHPVLPDARFREDGWKFSLPCGLALTDILGRPRPNPYLGRQITSAESPHSARRFVCRMKTDTWPSSGASDGYFSH